uniref:Protein yippee-like n=1 Tax=Rhizophora mucronata TaxID=61149 RepID=A0A2P2JS33_RHIMU
MKIKNEESKMTKKERKGASDLFDGLRYPFFFLVQLFFFLLLLHEMQEIWAKKRIDISQL